MTTNNHPTSVLISQCLMEGSSRYTHGMYVDLRYGNVSVINSTFKSLARPIDLRFHDQCQNINIERNRVENTLSQRHIDLYKSGSGKSENCTLNIVDNIVSQDSGDTSQTGGVRVWARYDIMRINLDRNSLSGINYLALYLYLYHTSALVSVSENVIADCEKAMHVEAYGGSATVSIHQNTVLRNFGTDIIKLITADYLKRPLEFERNSMRNNSNTVVTVEASNALLHYNVFNNPDATSNIKVSTSQGGYGDVNATLNYWGSVDSRQIAGKLYDQRSNPALPLVIYQPYFENSSLSSVYEETRRFVTPDGILGGDVNGNVTLTVEGSPYTAVSSINVLPGDVLQVEAGVEINFLPNIGVTVEGALIVEGNIDNPVNFLPQSTEKKWRGIEFLHTE
ncbi:protein bark beetle-like [Liolophura sinensis]|uniref:protein bark beetle-like n=1 Tax=Liolophura sinensis TaxID=3198878 RepID=UPI00315904BD